MASTELVAFISCACGKVLRASARDVTPETDYALAARCWWCGREWVATTHYADTRMTHDTDPARIAPTKRIYVGQILLTGNGEEEDVLALDRSPYEPLAELVQDAIEHHGAYLSVRYYVSEQPLAGTDEPVEAYQRMLYGESDAKYGMTYSEPTGYLWTDEELHVGGHDLLREIKSAVGKWLWMEITYSKLPRADVMHGQEGSEQR